MQTAAERNQSARERAQAAMQAAILEEAIRQQQDSDTNDETPASSGVSSRVGVG